MTSGTAGFAALSSLYSVFITCMLDCCICQLVVLFHVVSIRLFSVVNLYSGWSLTKSEMTACEFPDCRRCFNRVVPLCGHRMSSSHPSMLQASNIRGTVSFKAGRMLRVFIQTLLFLNAVPKKGIDEKQ